MGKIVFAYHGRYFVRDSNTVEYLSAIAKNFGYETELVYAQDIFGVTDNVFHIPLLNKWFASDEKTAGKILKSGADYVVFLRSFHNGMWIDSLQNILRKSGYAVKTVVISPLPDRAGSLSCDHSLTGEPEKIFSDFLCALKDGGLAGREFVSAETVSLDLLPQPDKEIFAKYTDFSQSYMIYTSKGCQSACSYCEETIYKKHYKYYYRRRTPWNVIAELKKAKADYGVREIIFKDSIFTSDSEWIEKFLILYRAEVSLPFKCFAKADSISEKLIAELKNSGCYCVEFGVQTLNEEIRKNILCRTDSMENLEKALFMCDRYGLKYDLDHMFGLPNESVADHIKAVRFYKGLQHLNRVKCHNLVYYSGSEIFKYAPDNIKSSCMLQTDFFSEVAGEGAVLEANKAFQKIFKLIFLIPETILKSSILEKHWRLAKLIPSAVIPVLQLMLAVKNRDLRFRVYLKNYPLKLKLVLAGD